MSIGAYWSLYGGYTFIGQAFDCKIANRTHTSSNFLFYLSILAAHVICYEHPLNERIRMWLRLEELFDKVAFFSAKEDALDHHVALVTLFEILDVASRTDVKSDLLKELDRQKQSLEAGPNVSGDVRNEILSSIQLASQSMRNMSGKVGDQIRENEWLTSIKQRLGIPGGVCEFDLPSYHHWLHLDPQERRDDLNEWLEPLLPIEKSYSALLQVLRNSGKTVQCKAQRGMFQQMGAGKVAHMLSLEVDRSRRCIPEVSANKYAITIRLLVFSSKKKTGIYEEDVDFDLTFYTL